MQSFINTKHTELYVSFSQVCCKRGNYSDGYPAVVVHNILLIFSRGLRNSTTYTDIVGKNELCVAK